MPGEALMDGFVNRKHLTRIIAFGETGVVRMLAERAEGQRLNDFPVRGDIDIPFI